MKIKATKIKLSSHWTNFLTNSPETGMGYQVCTVTLKNGEVYPGVVVRNCETVASVGGENGIPFSNNDIQKIDVTNDKQSIF